MEDLDFDNWVDQVYWFMHFLNLLKPMVPWLEPSPTYTSKGITTIPTDNTPLSYDLFP